jgi:hypothetical protein
MGTVRQGHALDEVPRTANEDDRPGKAGLAHGMHGACAGLHGEGEEAGFPAAPKTSGELEEEVVAKPENYG